MSRNIKLKKNEEFEQPVFKFLETPEVKIGKPIATEKPITAEKQNFVEVEQENPKSEIRNKIRELLAQKGFSQAWLAEFTGISNGTISNIINNKVDISLSNAFKIAEVLDTTVDNVFYSYSEDTPNYDTIAYTFGAIVIAENCTDDKDVLRNLQNKKKVHFFNTRLTKINND